MQHSEKWLTSKGIADYCMVSRVTVRRWIKGGKLTAIKLPSGHFRVTFGGFQGLPGEVEHTCRGLALRGVQILKKGGEQ